VHETAVLFEIVTKISERLYVAQWQIDYYWLWTGQKWYLEATW